MLNRLDKRYWECGKLICGLLHESKCFENNKVLRQYVREHSDLLPDVVMGFDVTDIKNYKRSA